MALDVSLIFLLLTLNIFHTFSSVCIVGFEQVNVSWDVVFFYFLYYLLLKIRLFTTLTDSYSGHHMKFLHKWKFSSSIFQSLCNASKNCYENL